MNIKTMRISLYLILVMSAVCGFSIQDRNMAQEQNVLLHLGNMMPRAKVTPVDREGSCVGDYKFETMNREIGVLESYAPSDPAYEVYWRFRLNSQIPPHCSGVKSINDILMNGWYDGNYTYKEGTRKAFAAYLKRIDVASLIRADKLEGGLPWPEVAIRGYLESNKAMSQASKQANNLYGVKCNAHGNRAQNKAFHVAARKRAIAAGKSSTVNVINGVKTCYWGGGDDNNWDHYKYYPSFAASHKGQANVLSKERYAWFTHLPYNEEITCMEVQMKGHKFVYFHGEKIKNGEELALTNIDWWHLGLSASYYATDNNYATKRSGIYWSYFGDWTLDDWYFFEHEMVPELGTALNRNPQYAEAN